MQAILYIDDSFKLFKLRPLDGLGLTMGSGFDVGLYHVYKQLLMVVLRTANNFAYLFWFYMLIID